MPTLEQLEARKRELETQLADGDVAAETKLEQVDRAIRARALEVEYARKRHAAVKDAVAAGVSREEALRRRSDSERQRLARAHARRPLNRF